MSVKADYFDSIVKSYVDVPIEDGIDVPEFLEATESLIGIFGKFIIYYLITFLNSMQRFIAFYRVWPCEIRHEWKYHCNYF